MNNGKEQQDNVGFAYTETSKKGVRYLKVTLDLSKLKGQGDKVKLLGFITTEEQIAKGAANGKSVPNIRFIESIPQEGAAKSAPKTANKSSGLPF